MTRSANLRRAFGWTAALAALHVAWYGFSVGGEAGVRIFGDVFPIPIVFGVGALCWRASRRFDGRERRGWKLLGAAAASWGCGEIVWTVCEFALHQRTPFPSFADLGFLGMIPLAAAAVLSLSTPMRAAVRLRTVLDSLIIGGSVLFVGWMSVLGPTLHEGGSTIAERAIGTAYPLGDIVIIAIVLFTTRGRGRERAPVGLLGAGLACLAFSDSGFIYLTQHGRYDTGNMIDVGWTLGFCLLGIAAVAAKPSAVAPAAPDDHDEFPTLVPFAATFVAILAAAIEELVHQHLGPFLFWTRSSSSACC
jgi:hypothetical protein